MTSKHGGRFSREVTSQQATSSPAAPGRARSSGGLEAGPEAGRTWLYPETAAPWR